MKNKGRNFIPLLAFIVMGCGTSKNGLKQGYDLYKSYYISHHAPSYLATCDSTVLWKLDNIIEYIESDECVPF